jgi:hypothetical protein
MGISVKDFTGNWYVWWVDGERSFLQKGWQVALGTGQSGAKAPFLNAELQVVMGFSILSPNSDGTWTPVFSTQDQQQQPLELLFADGSLRWIGYYGGQPLRIYISACEANTPGGESVISLYGSTVFGDPDQVGVWGANDRPPGG